MSDSSPESRLDNPAESSSIDTLDDGISEAECEGTGPNIFSAKKKRYIHAIMVGAAIYYEKTKVQINNNDGDNQSQEQQQVLEAGTDGNDQVQQVLEAGADGHDQVQQEIEGGADGQVHEQVLEGADGDHEVQQEVVEGGADGGHEVQQEFFEAGGADGSQVQQEIEGNAVVVEAAAGDEAAVVDEDLRLADEDVFPILSRDVKIGRKEFRFMDVCFLISLFETLYHS
ncbi:uncharacterized protein [Henckelia pumila]|uniref:uncharacterized protein n=1 Tax=Henckelia pumila TaxID=405737 RepID=UPI003C6E2717